MNILVTGAQGFIGKNLIAELNNQGYKEIDSFDVSSSLEELDKYCERADFVFHLAGVNRPEKESEFFEGNVNFTSQLIASLQKNKNYCPVLSTSSIHAEKDNPYGKSKKQGELLLFNYGQKLKVKTLIYRLPNVFGKWCRPNYNSAVATFCHNIANKLPITINNRDYKMTLVYIDDVVSEMIKAMHGYENQVGQFCEVTETHEASLGEIADLIKSFSNSRKDLSIPMLSDPFVKKLYSTYLSYLPENQLGYKLKMNKDNRGSFTEFIKTSGQGQVSVNISKPGITKGNHWHHTKNEKFLVVSGKGVIRFRNINSEQVIEYHVSGDELEVIDIPPGLTHNIENIGDTDMVTIMWANEKFDPDNPDTIFLEV